MESDKTDYHVRQIKEWILHQFGNKVDAAELQYRAAISERAKTNANLDLNYRWATEGRRNWQATVTHYSKAYNGLCHVFSSRNAIRRGATQFVKPIPLAQTYQKAQDRASQGGLARWMRLRLAFRFRSIQADSILTRHCPMD